MSLRKTHGWLRGIAYAVILLMVLTILFSLYISITHWAGIGV